MWFFRSLFPFIFFRRCFFQLDSSNLSYSWFLWRLDLRRYTYIHTYIFFTSEIVYPLTSSFRFIIYFLVLYLPFFLFSLFIRDVVVVLVVAVYVRLYVKFTDCIFICTSILSLCVVWFKTMRGLQKVTHSNNICDSSVVVFSYPSVWREYNIHSCPIKYAVHTVHILYTDTHTYTLNILYILTCMHKKKNSCHQFHVYQRFIFNNNMRRACVFVAAAAIAVAITVKYMFLCKKREKKTQTPSDKMWHIDTYTHIKFCLWQFNSCWNIYVQNIRTIPFNTGK